MKLFLRYISIVILALIVCDILITFVVEKIEGNRFSPTIYSVYYTSPQIAIMGSSRASHHYIPQILTDSLQLTAQNYGVGAKNIYIHYLLLQMLLEKAQQKPKIIILELSDIDLYDIPQWNEETTTIAYPYYHKEKCVRQLLDQLLDPKEACLINISGLYRHNSNYILYLKQKITQTEIVANHGYVPLYGQWNHNINQTINQTNNPQNQQTIHPLKKTYINKYVQTCKKNGIKLFFAVSPYYKKTNGKQAWITELEQIAQNNDITFLHHENDSLFLQHREWFKDPLHLNDKGAHIYTKTVCSEIKGFNY